MSFSYVGNEAEMGHAWKLTWANVIDCLRQGIFLFAFASTRLTGLGSSVDDLSPSLISVQEHWN